MHWGADPGNVITTHGYDRRSKRVCSIRDNVNGGIRKQSNFEHNNIVLISSNVSTCTRKNFSGR